MKAIRVEACGGPEQLKLVDAPTPTPGAGEVLVRVEAAGVNFIDVYFRMGLYKRDLPMPLGEEGAGVVEAIGAGVSDVKAGDRVAWAQAVGSYATHVIAAAAKLVRVPDGVTATVAAAAMLQGMTAHYLVTSTFPLAKGQACVVHAAAGGVGLLLCQLGRRIGARVIGTVSTREKAEIARAHGADETILYTETDFREEVMRLTNGKGVDVVYDSVGKTTFDKSLASLRPRGMLVAFGQSSGAIAPVDPLRLSTGGSLFLTRPTLRDYVATREELTMRAGAILAAIAKGELRMTIEPPIALADAAEAHRRLEGRKTVGKVVLIP
jgi:NADPH:quinone reductase